MKIIEIKVTLGGSCRYLLAEDRVLDALAEWSKHPDFKSAYVFTEPFQWFAVKATSKGLALVQPGPEEVVGYV